MSKTVESYLKRVRRKLCAGSRTKDELIQGLRSELVELGDEPSYDDLISTFGTPSQGCRRAAKLRGRNRGIFCKVFLETRRRNIWRYRGSARCDIGIVHAVR